MKTKLIAFGASVVGATGLVGCAATTPVPADKLARAQETVRLAEAAPPASMDTKAAQHLQLAKDQLTHGRKLVLEGKNEQARWALMRAQADGELAVYQAQAQAAKNDAQVTLDAIAQQITQMQQEGP